MKTLVLNANFLPLHLVPISTIPWQDAVCLIYKDKATVIEEYDEEIHSPSTTMKIPSVIVLREYKYFKTYAKLNKYNIKLRDGFKCQYCGKTHSHKSLTVDHVLPKAKGGKNTWENLVAACKPCNASKKDKMFSPIKKPIKPTYYFLAKQLVKHEKIMNEHWKQYLGSLTKDNG